METPKTPAEPLVGEDHYRQLFDLTSDSLFLIDRDTGKLLDANRSASALYGYSQEELLGLCNTDLSAEPDQTRQALRSEAPNVLVRWHRKKDGVVFPVEITASYLERDGRVLQIAAIRDITARLEALRALRESEALFSAFMDRLPSFVFIKDEELRPVYANRAFRERFPFESWRGRTPHECFAPEFAEQMVERDREALARGSVAYTEEWRDITGVRRYLSTVKFRIDRPGQGPLLGALASDVSQELAVHEAQINARRIESLGALAGGIAHEFNNLLTGLFGGVSLARTEAEDLPHIARPLDDALGAYSRARALTQRLLTFAKGGAPILRGVEIGPFVQDIVRFAFSGASSAVSFEMPAGLWTCEIDRQQIAQVLDDIARNAREAMQDSGVLLVNAANLDPAASRPRSLSSRRYVVIEVADNGPGIAVEHVPRVFDPFFTTKGQGRGLGLATAYSILHRHGGTIEVDSVLGQGTTFRVYLPVPEESVPSPEPRLSEPYVPSAMSGPCRVLVLDDEPLVRKLLTAALERFGCECECVPEGSLAVDLHRRALEQGTPFTWAILDLTVPGGMGGADASKAICACDPAFPMVVTSGYSDDPIMAEPSVFGFVDSLTKPFRVTDVQRLIERMRGLLERRAAKEDASA